MTFKWGTQKCSSRVILLKKVKLFKKTNLLAHLSCCVFCTLHLSEYKWALKLKKILVIYGIINFIVIQINATVGRKRIDFSMPKSLRCNGLAILVGQLWNDKGDIEKVPLILSLVILINQVILTVVYLLDYRVHFLQFDILC